MIPDGVHSIAEFKAVLRAKLNAKPASLAAFDIDVQAFHDRILGRSRLPANLTVQPSVTTQRAGMEPSRRFSTGLYGKSGATGVSSPNLCLLRIPRRPYSPDCGFLHLAADRFDPPVGKTRLGRKTTRIPHMSPSITGEVRGTLKIRCGTVIAHRIHDVAALRTNPHVAAKRACDGLDWYEARTHHGH